MKTTPTKTSRQRRKKKQPAPPEPIKLKPVGVTLTPDTQQILKLLVQDAKDWTGRTVSGSGIIRALLTYASRQPVDWQREQLFALVEQEQLSEPFIWGKRPKKK